MSSNKLGIATIRNYWCNTARPVRIFGLNGIIFGPVFLTMMHLRTWTVVTLVVFAIVLVLMERRGFTPQVCFLLIRGRLSGNRVSSTRRVGARRIWSR